MESTAGTISRDSAGRLGPIGFDRVRKWGQKEEEGKVLPKGYLGNSRPYKYPGRDCSGEERSRKSRLMKP